VKEGGQLANVMDYPVAKKKVAENVKCEMTKLVNRVEARKREVFDLSRHPALPKEGSLRNSDKGHMFVPEAEVQLDAEGHFRIERIAPPPPVTEPNESCIVIGSFIVGLIVEHVANGLQRGSSCLDGFRLAE
jgi:hypothetical protein